MTRHVEALKSAVSETALASVALYHVSSAMHATDDMPGHGQGANMADLQTATRRLRESIAATARHFQHSQHDQAAGIDAFLHHTGILVPPDKMVQIWRGDEARAGIEVLLHEQFTTCQQICTSPSLTNTETVAHLKTLNETVIKQLLPRLTELRKAAAAWNERLLNTTFGVILAAFACIVASILFTRFGVVGPLLRDLDAANANLSAENDKLEQRVAIRTDHLLMALDRAETAHETRTRFLASINHEMRTPLNGVLGIAALLRATALDGNQSRLVDTIVSSGQILVRLIDDVLDYVSLGAGKMQLINQTVPLKDVVLECIELQRAVAEAKGLAFEFESTGRNMVPVEVDPDRIQQIVNNIVGNAIKFTSEGFIRVSLNQHRHKGVIHATLRFSDSGIGIAQDKLERVFEPFDRAALGVPTSGAGLGLAVTKALVEEMAGTIDVESEPGQGTRFTVALHLPMAVEDQAMDAA